MKHPTGKNRQGLPYKRSRLATITAMAGFLILTFTVHVSAEDLVDVYRMAMSTSPRLKEARALLESDIAARRIAESALLPHLGARAETSYDHAKIKGFGQDFSLPSVPGGGGSAFGDIEETYWAGSYSVSLTQSLVDGQAWANVSAAGARVRAAKVGVIAAEQDLALQVIDSYFEVLNARAEKRVATGQKALLKEILDQAQAALKVGTGDIISLQEARARFDAAESSVIAAGNRVQVARQQLIRLTHQPVGELPDLERFEPRPPEPDQVDPWLEIARLNRPVLAQATQSYHAALDQVEASRRARWPDLNLTAGYGYNKGDFLPSTESRKAQVGLSVTLPIYQGGRIGAGLRQARSQAAATRYRIDDLSDEVNLNVETAFANLETSVAQLRAARQALESAKTSYAATKKGYEVGTRTVIDLLTSAQDLESVQRTYYESLYRHVVSRARLKWASGILGPGDVASINSLLTEP